MKFSEKLQILRKENKLSQEELAAMLDVSRQAVSKWESGQTYPEMDKLLTMCKIFKCSLDDLTNDEIKEINIDTTKNKTKLNNFIDEGLLYIKKCIYFLKGLTFKDFLKLLVEVLVVLLIIGVIHIPFRFIYDAGRDLFYTMGDKAGSILSSFFNFILMLVYIAISIFFFIYFLKVRYLDDIELAEDVKKEYKAKEVKIVKNVEKVNKDENKNIVIIEKNEGKNFFDALAHIVMIFVKAMLFLFSIPFLITLIVSSALLIMDIILMFKQIFYIGILMCLIAFIMLNIVTLKMLYYFIFNLNTNLKREIIIFLIGIAALGIGAGITMIEVSNTKYIDDMPVVEDETKITKEFTMTNNLFVDELDTYPYVSYKVDETLKDKVKVEIRYLKNNFNDVDVVTSNNMIKFEYEYNYGRTYFIKNGLNLIINNLKNKEVYNYDKLNYLNVVVTSSNANIKKLKENFSNYNDGYMYDYD